MSAFQFAKGTIRQEMALLRIQKTLEEVYPEPLVEVRQIRVGERLAALSIGRQKSEITYGVRDVDSSYEQIHSYPTVSFARLVRGIHATIGSTNREPKIKSAMFKPEGLGFHIDHLQKADGESVGIRFWHSTQGKSISQFAVLRSLKEAENLAFDLHDADERMANAQSLETSSDEYLEEGSILAFAPSFEIAESGTEVMSAGTPHRFICADDENYDRRTEVSLVRVVDPLAELTPEEVDSILREQILTPSA